MRGKVNYTQDDAYSGAYFKNKIIKGNKGLYSMKKVKDRTLDRLKEVKKNYQVDLKPIKGKMNNDNW